MAIQKITSGIIQDGAIAAADIVSVSNTAISGNIASSQIAPDQTLNGNVSVTGTLSTPNTFGFKNRIINGGMVIDQRNAGAAVTVNTVSKTYSVDRFCGTGISAAGVFTLQQTSTVPSNFINSLKATVTTADASLAATDLYRVMHLIEGLNCADLGWGTATAQTVTLSFWVYSNLTGTFGGSLTNSAVNRSYPFTFTISVANTWEQKTITVAGDTSGTWLTTSGIGIAINFGLGVGSTYSGTASVWAGSEYYSATGSTNVMATLSNTFYITGVQLEKGSTATSFDFRAYSTELAMCQRYYYQLGTGGQTGVPFGIAMVQGGSNVLVDTFFPTTMRAVPSFSSSAFSTFSVYSYSADYSTSGITFNHASPNIGEWYLNASGVTAGNSARLQSTSSAAYVAFSSEL